MKELIKSKIEVNYIDFPYLTVDPTLAVIRTKGVEESKKLILVFENEKNMFRWC